MPRLDLPAARDDLHATRHGLSQIRAALTRRLSAATGFGAGEHLDEEEGALPHVVISSLDRLEARLSALALREQRRLRYLLFVLGFLLVASTGMSLVWLRRYRRQWIEQAGALVETDSELRATQARYQTLVEQSSDALYLRYLESGRFLYVNQQFCELFGYTREEVLGLQYLDMVAPDDRQRVMAKMRGMKEQREWAPFALSALRKDGGSFIGEVAPVPVTYQGQPCIQGTVRDITDRHFQEQFLRTEREHYQEAQEVAGVGHWELDLRTHRLDWSEGVYGIFGLSPDGFCGTFEDFLDRVHPDDRHRVEQAYQESVGSREPYDIDHRILSPDGSIRYVNERCRNYCRGDGTPERSVGIVRDVTGRKQAELQTQHRERALSAVADASLRFMSNSSWEGQLPWLLRCLGEAIEVSRVYLFDYHRGERGERLATQRFEWVAPGIEPQIDNPELQNFDMDAGGLRRIWDLMHAGEVLASQVKKLAAAERTVMESEGIRSLTMVPVITDAGCWGFLGFDECLRQRRWGSAEIDSLQSAAGVLGAAISRQDAEQALRMSESRFRQLAENIDEVFWILDLASGRAEYVSPAYMKVCGADAAELYRNAMAWLEHVHPEDRSDAQAVIENAASGEGQTFEFRILHPEKGVRWIRERCFPIMDDDVFAGRLAGVARDVTEQKRAERERLLAERRQRDTLVREVHHRIKNHLQGITGLLSRQGDGQPQAQAALHGAIAQIEAIAAVHGLLSKGSGCTLTPELLINSILTWIQDLFRARVNTDLDPNIIGRFSIAEEEGVPLALVVNEILTNALKHRATSSPDAETTLRLAGDGEGALRLTVSAPGKALPLGFDFSAGVGLGQGLRLIRALLPPTGAKLDFVRTEEGVVVVTLSLAAPVLQSPPSASDEQASDPRLEGFA